MKRPLLTTTFYLLLGGVLGCGSAYQPAPSAPSSRTGPPPASAPGSPPATAPSPVGALWSEPQVEQWLKQELKLTQLSLTRAGKGNYEGQGRDASGKTYQLKITQVLGGIACDYTSGVGSTGRIAFGNSVPTAGAPALASPSPASSAPPAPDGPDAQIPDNPVSGRIHGRDFTLEKAALENGVLTLRQGKERFPDLALDVMMFIKQGEPLDGKKVHVAPGASPGKPLLRLQWREPGEGMPKTEHFSSNYRMILEFGHVRDGKAPGKIYVAVPDATKSSLSGTFVIEGVR